MITECSISSAVSQPSDRGELEITDVNNRYIEQGEMTYDILDGWWTDAGTMDSLLRANNLVAQGKEKTGQTRGEKGEQPTGRDTNPDYS